MIFQLEKDMTESIKKKLIEILKKLNNKNNKDSYIYACEFPVYYRMIDITIAMFCKQYNEFEECISYEKILKKLTSKCFGILTFISMKNKVSIDLLHKSLLIDRTELKESLDLLCKLNLIEKISNYSYQLTSWKVLIPKELISIELKLSKWHEALEQGIFNQKFAEYSFVVLDLNRIKSDEKIINYYKSNNVGLIYLKNENEIEIKYIPKKNNKIDKYSNHFHKIKILKDFIVNEGKWKEIP